MTHFLPVVDAMVCHLDANPPLRADMHIPPNAGNVGRGAAFPKVTSPWGHSLHLKVIPQAGLAPLLRFKTTLKGSPQLQSPLGIGQGLCCHITIPLSLSCFPYSHRGVGPEIPPQETSCTLIFLLFADHALCLMHRPYSSNSGQILLIVLRGGD